MNIRSFLGGFEGSFVGYKFLFGRELKLYIFRLRRAAIFTGLYSAFVARSTIGTGPFILNITKSSSACHEECSFFSASNYKR
jgi:hypothetical protein